MDLSPSQKGLLVENYISNSIMLQGRGNIVVAKPIIDEDGVDLILYRKDNLKTLFCQVKSRFSLNKNNCQFQIRKNTFRTDDKIICIFVYFLEEVNRIKYIWCVPSKYVSENRDNETNDNLVVAPSVLDITFDKWSRYRISEDKIIDELSKYF